MKINEIVFYRIHKKNGAEPEIRNILVELIMVNINEAVTEIISLSRSRFRGKCAEFLYNTSFYFLNQF